MASFKFVRVVGSEHSKIQLVLPVKFVELYRDSLASFASLVLPCGHTWKIGLVRRDNKIFLQKKWPKFVQHYGIITNRYLLIFDYRGNSKFDVSITDESSCEIDYSHFPFHSDGKKNGKAPVICLASSEELSSYSDSDLDSNSACKGKSKISEEIEDDTPKKMKQRKKRYEGPYNMYKDTNAYKEASKVYSRNPLFKRIIRVKGKRRYNLRLPDSFVESHLGSKTQFISLKVGTKKWDVKLLNCKSGFFFSKGWAAFLDANSVNTGDACVFEFLSRKPALLKVSIIKNIVSSY
ncbi:B3 domain-containing transcription factor VRN1-like [Cannabis sativa]|uniref:B3 domain-containing transcription factor VRN1-like n=1 Tax=Cannabis sativa TaxID=3483 RepID=UPI0011DFB053|nr:B3 domain-containing transcription factor VRN1-like [Cannabis sativa]